MVCGPRQAARRSCIDAGGDFSLLGVDTTDLPGESKSEQRGAVGIEDEIMDTGRQRKGTQHGSGGSIEHDHAGSSFFGVGEQFMEFRRAQLQTMGCGESRGESEASAFGETLEVNHGYRRARSSHLVI